MMIMECICKSEKNWNPDIYFGVFNFSIDMRNGEILCITNEKCFPVFIYKEAIINNSKDSLIYHLFTVRFVNELYDLC